MLAQSTIPLLIVILVVFIPVFLVLVRRSIRGFGAMSDPTSEWASGKPDGEWRCGFDLRQPTRMTGSYPMGVLRVYQRGFSVTSAVGRLEFARVDLEDIRLEGPTTVRVFGRSRELRVMLRSPDATAALMAMKARP